MLCKIEYIEKMLSLMNILDYREFLKEGYLDPPEEPDPFVEEYETLLIEFEKKMNDEGLKIDSTDFYDRLQILDKYYDFNTEAEALMGNLYDKLYMDKKDFENGDDYMHTTPEYKQIEKEIERVRNLHPEMFKKYRSKMYNKALMEALYKNAIEKNWEEWKELYKKWLNILHNMRGTITGKAYGL